VKKQSVEFYSDSILLSGTLFLQSPKALDDNKELFIFVLTGDGPKGTTSKTWGPMLDLFEGLGVSYFIFDFVSQGHSQGSRDKLNIRSGVQSFEDAVIALEEKVNFENYKVGAFGSSFGGSVILACKSLIQKFSFLIFKSPASVLYEAYENEHDDFTQVAEWISSNYSKPTGLSAEAYKTAAMTSLYENVMKIEVPTLIVHGKADTIVPIKQSERLNSLIGSHSKLVALDGVNHGYKEPGATVALHTEIRNFLIEVIAI